MPAGAAPAIPVGVAKALQRRNPWKEEEEEEEETVIASSRNAFLNKQSRLGRTACLRRFTLKQF